MEKGIYTPTEHNDSDALRNRLDRAETRVEGQCGQDAYMRSDPAQKPRLRSKK